jgi:DNA-binding CsgD family transcriptional regulator
MAKWVVSSEFVEQIPSVARPSPRDYISYTRSNSSCGIGELLWEEVYTVERMGHLTPAQKAVLETWLMGNSQVEVSIILHVRPSTVHGHLKIALKKFQHVQYRGLITDLIERFGIRVVREHLADICE